MDGIAEANTAAGTSSATTAAAAAAAQQPPKTASQLQRIKEAIGANFLFRNLDEEQERDVLAAMREVKVGPGEVVIEQGAAGDYFYVIESGKFNIFKRQARVLVLRMEKARKNKSGVVRCTPLSPVAPLVNWLSCTSESSLSLSIRSHDLSLLTVP